MVAHTFNPSTWKSCTFNPNTMEVETERDKAKWRGDRSSLLYSVQKLVETGYPIWSEDSVKIRTSDCLLCSFDLQANFSCKITNKIPPLASFPQV